MNININPFKDQISVLIDDHKSASEIAKRIDVSESTVGKWKKGNTDPSRKNLLSICEEFEVNLLWLATGQGEKNKSGGEYGAESNAVVLATSEAPSEYPSYPKKEVRKSVGQLMAESGRIYESAIKAAKCEVSPLSAENIKALIYAGLSQKGKVEVVEVARLIKSINAENKD